VYIRPKVVGHFSEPYTSGPGLPFRGVFENKISFKVLRQNHNIKEYYDVFS
jgi:hypothetical protein